LLVPAGGASIAARGRQRVSASALIQLLLGRVNAELLSAQVLGGHRWRRDRSAKVLGSAGVDRPDRAAINALEMRWWSGHAVSGLLDSSWLNAVGRVRGRVAVLPVDADLD